VPLMGVLVMPAAVLAACLMPIGMEGIALWFMGLGLEWILGVAHRVSGLDGARGTVISPAPEVLPLMAFGALVVVLWQGRARWLGLGPAVLSVALWMQAARPDVLIADNGSLIGVLTEQGRALNRARGSGFVAMHWLENDGVALDQEAAADLWQRAQAPVPIIPVRGKRGAAAFQGCDRGDWVVMNTVPQQGSIFNGLPCRVVHPETLRHTGALALYKDGDGLREVSARQITGARLWNDQ